MKIEQSFRDLKSLLGLHKMMNKSQQHMEQMAALLMIAYAIGLHLHLVRHVRAQLGLVVAGRCGRLESRGKPGGLALDEAVDFFGTDHVPPPAVSRGHHSTSAWRHNVRRCSRGAESLR
jgi:hypothetical protein